MQIFRKQRIKKGSVIIKQEKPKVQNLMKITSQKSRFEKTLLANQLVEEFMLIANKEVCKYFQKNRPRRFRIHDKPDLDKLKSFSLFLKNKNVKFDFPFLKNLSNEINRVLGETSNEPDYEIINKFYFEKNRVWQLKYSTKNIGILWPGLQELYTLYFSH